MLSILHPSPLFRVSFDTPLPMPPGSAVERVSEFYLRARDINHAQKRSGAVARRFGRLATSVCEAAEATLPCGAAYCPTWYEQCARVFAGRLDDTY